MQSRPASSSSASTFIDDQFTATCVWKHCQIVTRGATDKVARFYMRSHQRTAAETSISDSHYGCQSSLGHLDGNPFYLMEEYCGVTLGRDVERMLSVRAEDARFSLLALIIR
jgi:hypothetical protein